MKVLEQMKKMITRGVIKTYFLAIFVMIFSSCQNDNEIKTTGDLVVTFKDFQYLSTTDLPKIYVMDDISYPLIEQIIVDSKGILRIQDLNYGNYYLMYTRLYDGGGAASFKKLFQIKANETTELSIKIIGN